MVRSGMFLNSRKAFATQVAFKFFQKIGKTCRNSDGAHRITQPNPQYNTGRGESQVGLVYDRDGYTFLRLHWEEGGRFTIILHASIHARRQGS